MRRHSAHRLTPAAGVLCALVALALGAAAAEPEPAEPEAASPASQAALVLVESFLSSPVGSGEEIPAVNTGFFVSSEGRVLTSLVAVSGCSRVNVRCLDGRQSAGRLYAFDQPSGLALLETDLKDTPALELSPDPPEPGQEVVAAASTCPRDGTVGVILSEGTVSSCEASVKLFGVQWERLIDAEVRVAQGCAAGPILDREGRLLGVVLGVESRADGSMCSYCLPAAALEPILSELMQGKTRHVGWLGIAVAYSGSMEGLTVQGVLEGSPAYAAELRPGDVLLGINGQSISQPAVFETGVAQAVPGSQIELGVLRGGEVKTVAVQVGARPLLISRIPVRMPYDSRTLQAYPLPPAMDMRTYLFYMLVIEDLQRQNGELRERLQRLEERLKRMEELQTTDR